MTTIMAFLSPKLGYFFGFLKKGRVDLKPLPPSSYAPVINFDILICIDIYTIATSMIICIIIKKKVKVKE